MAYIDFQSINQNRKLKLFFLNEQLALSNNFLNFFFLIPQPTYMNKLPKKIILKFLFKVLNKCT